MMSKSQRICQSCLLLSGKSYHLIPDHHYQSESKDPPVSVLWFGLDTLPEVHHEVVELMSFRI